MCLGIIGPAWLAGTLAAQEPVAVERIPWQFPTENRFLVTGETKKFFQPTISRRLKSGMFGFVRTSDPEPARMFERFHKGIDIRPLVRDSRGEPLDPVCAVADGIVVRVNQDERISDYGKQVIVKHRWGEVPVFSMYGHLASANTQVGQAVKAGDPLGILGWTGPGLDRSRAHLHLEIAFQINAKFDAWIRAAKPGRLWEPNRHGEWNGLNLMGIDPAPLLLAAQEGHPLTCREALDSQPGGFLVLLPALRGMPAWTDLTFPAERCSSAAGWKVEMTPWGGPLRMEPWNQEVVQPVLLANPGGPGEGKYYCRGLVEPDGQGGMRLSRFGRQTMEMMMFTGAEAGEDSVR